MILLTLLIAELWRLLTPRCGAAPHIMLPALPDLPTPVWYALGALAALLALALLLGFLRLSLVFWSGWALAGRMTCPACGANTLRSSGLQRRDDQPPVLYYRCTTCDARRAWSADDGWTTPDNDQWRAHGDNLQL